MQVRLSPALSEKCPNIACLRCCVDVIMGDWLATEVEAHLCELGRDALGTLGARVGKEDIRDLVVEKEGVESIRSFNWTAGLVHSAIEVDEEAVDLGEMPLIDCGRGREV